MKVITILEVQESGLNIEKVFSYDTEQLPLFDESVFMDNSITQRFRLDKVYEKLVLEKYNQQSPTDLKEYLKDKGFDIVQIIKSSTIYVMNLK